MMKCSHSFYLATALTFGAIIALTNSQTICPMPTFIGAIPFDNPAFLDPLPNGQGGVDLFVSTFVSAPFTSKIPTTQHAVWRIPDIDTKLTQAELEAAEGQVQVIDQKVVWPNGARPVPASVDIPGSTSLRRIVSCGGFLVPTHTNGECVVYDLDEATGQPLREIKLARAGFGNFFHEAKWYDVDGDGLDDLITARGTSPIPIYHGGPEGEMMWFRNPGKNSLIRNFPWLSKHFYWKGNRLFNGPDIFYDMKDLDGDGIPEFIAAQAFTSRLTVSWLKAGGVFGGGPSQWEQRVILDDLGLLFNLTFYNLTGNADRELVLTNHVDNATLSGVYLVEFPEDFKTGDYTVHTLQNDFPTLDPLMGTASPGGAIPFEVPGQPHPLIAVSGDGNYQAWIMCRNSTSDDPYDWQRELLVNASGTTGTVVHSDVDGDGYPEIFVAGYDSNLIYVYSYAP